MVARARSSKNPNVFAMIAAGVALPVLWLLWWKACDGGHTDPANTWFFAVTSAAAFGLGIRERVLELASSPLTWLLLGIGAVAIFGFGFCTEKLDEEQEHYLALVSQQDGIDAANLERLDREMSYLLPPIGTFFLFGIANLFVWVGGNGVGYVAKRYYFC